MKTLILLALALLISFFVIFYFIKKNKTAKLYEIDKPDFQQNLSKNLKEISGISYFDENQIICINDEVGRLFIYDHEKKEIIDTLEFEEDGDYEDVVLLDGISYVLRSDGQVSAFDINTKNTVKYDCSSHEVEEFEGLGYDPKSNALLLAAKEMKGEKAIFQFDLKNQKLTRKFSISKDDIKKNGKHGKEFKPSGIAVHPISGKIYVLASAGKKLLVLDENGNPKEQYNLNEDQFPQPEGICFTPNGDLIISSEGKNGQASISYFSFNDK
ncbi:SdiA-regulated [Spirosomataceae bacterium]